MGRGAVLRPSALAGLSALRSAVGSGWRHHVEEKPIEVAVDVARTLRDVPGFRVRRCADLQTRAAWNTSPPRIRIEHAAIDVASRQADRLSAVGVLADVCQSRRTPPSRILAVLSTRSRVRDRGWLREVLEDLAEGTCSVLEYEYLIRVERAHGLPRAERQPLDVLPQGKVYRDVTYRRFGLHVELDGRLFHDTADQRDRDLERDLATVVSHSSVRLGWGQVFGRPCLTAEAIGALLRARGWTGAPARWGSARRPP